MNNPEQFTVILRNEKIPLHRKLALAFKVINLIIFMLFLFSGNTLFAGIVGIVVIVSYFIYKNRQYKQKHLYNMVGPKLFYLLTIVWFLQNVFVAIFIFLTGVLLKFSTQPFKYVFTEDGIVRDFFPVKVYAWSEMNSVILRDGILTLDFKNNHLIQLSVENIEEIEISAFNEFSNKQLHKERP
jgi:hypothetical protein